MLSDVIVFTTDVMMTDSSSGHTWMNVSDFKTKQLKTFQHVGRSVASLDFMSWFFWIFLKDSLTLAFLTNVIFVSLQQI